MFIHIFPIIQYHCRKFWQIMTVTEWTQTKMCRPQPHQWQGNVDCDQFPFPVFSLVVAHPTIFLQKKKLWNLEKIGSFHWKMPTYVIFKKPHHNDNSSIVAVLSFYDFLVVIFKCGSFFLTTTVVMKNCCPYHVKGEKTK